MEVKSAVFGGQTHLTWAHFPTSAVGGRVGKVAGDHKVKRQKHSKPCHQKPQLDTTWLAIWTSLRAKTLHWEPQETDHQHELSKSYPDRPHRTTCPEAMVRTPESMCRPFQQLTWQIISHTVLTMALLKYLASMSLLHCIAVSAVSVAKPCLSVAHVPSFGRSRSIITFDWHLRGRKEQIIFPASTCLNTKYITQMQQMQCKFKKCTSRIWRTPSFPACILLSLIPRTSCTIAYNLLIRVCMLWACFECKAYMKVVSPPATSHSNFHQFPSIYINVS